MYYRHTALLSVFMTLCLACTAFSARQSVESYEGRSGDIIIQTNDVVDDSAILLHGDLFEGIQMKEIEDVRVADLLAHVMGTQPFNVYASREGFPKGGLFNKAKAALLITLDSVAPELFTKLSTWKTYQSVDVTTQTFPANTFTMASNLATGVHPSVHGIVGETWVMPNSKTTTAAGASLAANMADIMAQEWQDGSLLVSASASAGLASAFAVNKRFVGPNSYGVKMQSGAFQSLYTQSAAPFSLGEQQLESIMDSSAFAAFLGATVSDGEITVTVDSRSAVFDTNAAIDSALLAELSFVYNFLNVLESDSKFSSLVADSNPDFFAITFSSLKGIKDTYGENSAMFVGALMMVDSAVQKAVVVMDKLYKGRAVSAVVCLNTRSVVSNAVKQAVFSTVRDSLRSERDFDTYYPSLYIRGNPYPLCNQLRSEIESPSIQVHCLSSAYDFATSEYLLDPSNITNTTNTTTQAPLNVPAFWIFFWISIVLTAWILGGIYLMCVVGVEAAKDSLLFHSTGRHHHQN